jgi:hypothetical protein
MNTELESPNPEPGIRQTELGTVHSQLHPESREAVPFFKSWRRLYCAVLGELALLVVLFYLLMKVFS